MIKPSLYFSWEAVLHNFVLARLPDWSLMQIVNLVMADRGVKMVPIYT